MKKILLILLVGCMSLMEVQAQENQTEKPAEKPAKQYLPKAGDWSVGVDVTPLLKYAATIFNQKEGDLNYLGGSPFTKYGRLSEMFDDDQKTLMPDVSIMGKYFLSDEFALRANIGLKVSSETKRFYVDDDKSQWENTLDEEKVVDRLRNRRSGVSIMLGGEYRKGQRRVQGVFGAGLLFALMNDKVTCKYGNALTDVNQNPNDDDNMPSAVNGYRPLKYFNRGANCYLGLTGSAGVEWFMAPKVSLGAEVNLSLYYMLGKQTYLESEGYNEKTGRVEKRVDLLSPGDRGFYMATECLGGSLSLNFYF